MKKNYQNDEFLQKRKERQRKIRKRRAKIFLVFFLIALIVTGAVLSVTVLFPIKNITATGSKIYKSSQIIEECGINIGDNLIAASKDKALNNLRKKLPFVENVELKRSLPDKLNIKVTDAKEYTCYKVGNKYYSVSKNGWVLKSYSKMPNGITLIISDGIKCKVGTAIEFSDDSLKELYERATDTLNMYNFKVNYVDITDKMAIKAKVEGRFVVNFGSLKDLEPKVKHLKGMTENISKKDSGKINLSMWSRQNPQGAFTKTEIK